MLEGIGLAPETIRACYGKHPLNEEEAVQEGLIKWAEGHHGYTPTWRVLLDAMAYAGVAQQHCQGLRDELYQRLKSECVHVFAYVKWQHVQWGIVHPIATFYNSFLYQGGMLVVASMYTLVGMCTLVG